MSGESGAPRSSSGAETRSRSARRTICTAARYAGSCASSRSPVQTSNDPSRLCANQPSRRWRRGRRDASARLRARVPARPRPPARRRKMPAPARRQSVRAPARPRRRGAGTSTTAPRRRRRRFPARSGRGAAMRMTHPAFLVAPRPGRRRRRAARAPRPGAASRGAPRESSPRAPAPRPRSRAADSFRAYPSGCRPVEIKLITSTLST